VLLGWKVHHPAEFQAEKEQYYFEIDMANAEVETLEMEQAILYVACV
jgi:hypothetical protein